MDQKNCIKRHFCRRPRVLTWKRQLLIRAALYMTPPRKDTIDAHHHYGFRRPGILITYQSPIVVSLTRPIFASPTQVFKEKAENGGRILKAHPVTRWLFPSQPILPQQRLVVPNNQKDPPPRYEQPNRKYCGNRISTTKYSVFTFIPKNLFEQVRQLYTCKKTKLLFSCIVLRIYTSFSSSSST